MYVKDKGERIGSQISRRIRIISSVEGSVPKYAWGAHRNMSGCVTGKRGGNCRQ